jgi:hypothetical protein
MTGLNIGCIIVGIVGVLSIAVSVMTELRCARRRAREAKRRYIKDV